MEWTEIVIVEIRFGRVFDLKMCLDCRIRMRMKGMKMVINGNGNENCI